MSGHNPRNNTLWGHLKLALAFMYIMHVMHVMQVLNDTSKALKKIINLGRLRNILKKKKKIKRKLTTRLVCL